MKRLDTISVQVHDALPSEPSTYSVMAGDFLSEYRLRHLVDSVLPQLTAIRPQTAFNGELEAILLNPLYLLAKEILQGKSTPGRVTTHFLTQARRFALVAEITNLAAFRTQQITTGDMFITASHLAQFFTAREITGGKDDKPKSPAAQAQMVLSFLLGWEEQANGRKIDDAWIDQFKAASPKSIVDPSTVTDAFTAVQSLLYTYAGKGRGQAISVESYFMHLDACQTIEAAIRACLFPSLIATKDVNEDDYKADGYALAIAYIVYLSHSASVDAYDSVFPPSARSASAQTSNVLMGNSARRAAWFFAGLSSAPAIFDLVAMIHFIRNTIDFLSPILDTEISSYKNMMLDLDAAASVLSDNTVSPVQHHCLEILRRTTSVAGVDKLIPYFLKSKLNLTGPKFREEMLIMPGYPGLEPDFIKTISLTSSDVTTIFPDICDIVARIRRVAEEISYTMSSFHLSSEYDPNSFNIRSEIFSVHDDPTPAKDLRYASPVKKDVFPMSIPRYEVIAPYRPPRDRKWIFSQLQYGVVDLIALTRSIRFSSPRYVFDVDVSVPIARSLSANFAQIPIPLNYTGTTFFPNVGNAISDIKGVLLKNQAITTPSNYFEDAAAVIISSDRQRRAMARALAGICRVYYQPVGAPDRWYTTKNGLPVYCLNYGKSVPLPFIYGIPATAFFQAQESAADANEKHPERVKVVDMGDKGTVAFILHDVIPSPTPVVYVNAALDDGVISTIPCSIPWYYQGRKMIYDDHDLLGFQDVLRNTVNYEDEETKDKEIGPLSKVMSVLPLVPLTQFHKNTLLKEGWHPVTAWAHLTQYFPHLFFSVENPKWDADLLTFDLDEMNHVHFKRRLVPGARALFITSSVENYLAVIEPSDLVDMARAEDGDTKPVTFVDLAPAPAAKPSHPAPPKDPAVDTVTPVNPETTRPLEERVSTEEARHVTTEAILRGDDKGNNTLVTSDDVIPGNEDFTIAPKTGTLGGEPKTKTKKTN